MDRCHQLLLPQQNRLVSKQVLRPGLHTLGFPASQFSVPKHLGCTSHGVCQEASAITSFCITHAAFYLLWQSASGSGEVPNTRFHACRAAATARAPIAVTEPSAHSIHGMRCCCKHMVRVTPVMHVHHARHPQLQQSPCCCEPCCAQLCRQAHPPTAAACCCCCCLPVLVRPCRRAASAAGRLTQLLPPLLRGCAPSL
jgi:hypothetical protein